MRKTTTLLILIVLLFSSVVHGLQYQAGRDDGGDYYDVFVLDDIIYTTCGNSGLRAYSFNGQSFSLIDTIDNGSEYYGVWSIGSYVFVACQTEGLRAYTFDGTSFTLKDTQDDGGVYTGVHGNSSYVYASCGADGLRAYTFDGTTLSLVTTVDNSSQSYMDVDIDENYVYTVVEDAGLFAYSFNGTNFTFIDSIDNGSDYRGIYVDTVNDYIHTSCVLAGVRAYTFNGTNFSYITVQDDGDYYNDVYGDSVYIYIGNGLAGVRKYTFNGTSYTLLDTEDEGGTYYGLYSDHAYLYTSCKGSGIRAYEISDPSPDVPYNVSVVYNTTLNQENISWTSGNYSQYDVVVEGTTGYPTLVSDGTTVQNSSSLDYYLFTPTGTHYFCLFSYNNVTGNYSNPVQVVWGAVGMSCYNESNPSQAIDFDIEISNQNGTDVYVNTSLTNTFYINYADIPFGTNSIFTVSNSSYETRQYLYDLSVNTFYNLSFYLPRLILESVETELYTIRVIDDYAYPVSDAEITIKRYNNVTDVYETVTSLKTNGYGEADAYLIPNTNYKFFITKSGYNDFVNDSFTDPVFYGKNYPIILQLTSDFDDSPDYGFYDLISFNATLYSNNTIKVVYVDSNSETNSAVFTTYETYNNTRTLIATNTTTANSFTFWITGVNRSRQHIIFCDYSHETLGSGTEQVIVLPLRDSLNRITEVNNIFGDIMGTWTINNGGLGYVEFFMIVLPTLALIVIAAAVSHVGAGIFVGGAYMGWVSFVVFDVPSDLISVGLVVFIIAIGIIVEAVKGGVLHL